MASRVPKVCQKQKKLNSLYYLKKAKQSCSDNNYAEAYKYFVHYFESLNDPAESSEAVQAAFTKLVCKMGNVLEESDNIEELLKCYLQALNLFPENYMILNNLGAYMFRLGETDIAKRYLEKAITVNENYLPAEINLMHVKWHQIPRWHFRMLNDKRRNLAYQKAISSMISKGYSNVIDIGSGCGLLTLISAKFPNTNVVAIEENKNLYKICSDVLKEKEANNVLLLNCYSTDLEEPPSKCNLIVTETFDVALFGERALESIFHALMVLRTEPDFAIIPCRANVYATGISCKSLLSKYRGILDESLNLLSVGDVCVRKVDAEPYEGEYLLKEKVTYLTNTQRVFSVNFYDHENIRKMLEDENYHEIVRLACKKGTVHAIAVWFDLFLTEEVQLTTDPFKKECVTCWEQAVFYLEHPVEVEEGDVLVLKASVVDCKLKFTTVCETEKDHECFEVSSDVITFLNDRNLVRAVLRTAEQFDVANGAIADFNVLPLLGFLLAKKKYTVYHLVKNPSDIKFFQHILKRNNIQEEKFTMHSDLMNLKASMTNKPPNVYFFDPIDTDGSLENVPFKDVSRSLLIPKSFKINVALVYSEYINFCNKVDDYNVLGFGLAKYINEYSGSEHPNLENFIMHQFSEPVKFNFQRNSEDSQPVCVKKDGRVNCLLFWYELELLKNVNFSTLTSSHFKKSCFFFEPRVVKKSEMLRIVMKTDGSYLKFTLTENLL